MDLTGSVSLTLYDKQALPIIDKSAAEILQEVRKKGYMDILPTDFNKLLEKIYAFKVDIKDFNIEKDKHTYVCSLTPLFINYLILFHITDKYHLILEEVSLRDLFVDQDLTVSGFIRNTNDVSEHRNKLATLITYLPLPDDEKRDLISCGTIAHAMVDGNRHPYIRLELEDLTGTKHRNITLWDDYALQLNNALGDRQNLGHVVIILQFVKHKIYKRKHAVSIVFGVSKLFINDDIPYIRNFKQKLIDNPSHEGDDHCVQIPLRVMESSGSVSLTLFDKQALPIIDKGAVESLQEVRKGDMDILPTDFNKLLEKIYAFKVDIKDFNNEKVKHTYDKYHLILEEASLRDLFVEKDLTVSGFIGNTNSGIL
nr:hypothetical protein [Tanacetum cinerariifolium]